MFKPGHLWANINALPSVPKALLGLVPLLLGLSFFTILADAWRAIRPAAASPLTAHSVAKLFLRSAALEKPPSARLHLSCLKLR